MNTGRGDPERRVTSLRDLPGAIAPPRDLWPGIEAQIAGEAGGGENAGLPGGAEECAQVPGGGEAYTEVPGVGRACGQLRRSVRWRRYRAPGWIAAAAVVVVLAFGMWIGHEMLPISASVRSAGTSESPSRGNGATSVAYVSDPRYRQQREQLVRSLQARLAALPPASRAKVVSSLAAIRNSIADLQSALGRDPSNALLQEMLVDTYQDEMRVLTAVHEASDAAKGI